jgi:UDP-glucose 4-epimerase
VSAPSPAYPLEGRTAVVTGGGGFIGSALVRRLLAKGVRRVVALDSLRHGPPDSLRALGVAVDVVPFELGGDDAGRLAPILAGADYLFHLAAEKHRVAEQAPHRVVTSNVSGTHDLLEAAGAAGIRKVVFASSVYAYGRWHAPAMDEAEVPHPDNLYGITKLAGEHLVRRLRRATGIPAVSLRYFFVYGPGQTATLGYRSVIVENFERLRRGESATVVGDGRQALDYVFVDDVVEATLLALESKVEEGVFNVGSGEPAVVDDLISLLIATAGGRAAKTHLPPDPTAGTWRVARIDRAREVLGWSPRTSLAEGIARTWAWIQERRA